MQPYFFPYIGYFNLIRATDLWIVFDTPQYIRRGWVNRNRVLSDGTDSWKYVRVPVIHSPRETAIRDIQIDPRQDWATELLQNLDVYERRRAPFFHSVRQWFQTTVSSAPDSARLSPLLIHLLKETCQYLQLPFQYQVYSEMNLNRAGISDAGQWALQTAIAVNAKTYINPPGGREIFDAASFHEAGIELLFLEPALTPYDQKAPTFTPGLSILDVMMWNSPEQIQKLLPNYSLVSS